MTVRRERDGQTALWVIDRPAARNAIHEEVATDLEAALDEAERDRALCAVVITAEGEHAFVAGADLKFLRSASPEARASLDARMVKILDRMEALPVPVIAALNGVAVGGGAELLLAADMRIAEPHSSITFKHTAMGVTPGWGGLSRLCALVGRGAASKLLFTAHAVSSEEALRMGLVDELVGSGEARTRALALGALVAENSPAAVADVKRLLSRAYREGASAIAEDERRTFLERAVHGDHAEALAAFFEKRAARFAARE